MTFKRSFKLVLLVTLCFLLTPSFTTPLATHAQAERTGILRVGWTHPTTLDPALYNDAPDISVGVAIYNYLITLDQESNLVASLAKSWNVSDDGKVYTLTLQDGVTFHDGSTFSAEDVKFTFERLQNPDLKSGAAGLLAGIEQIEVVDPLTVRFTLKEPNGIFLATLADYHMAILKNGTVDPAKEMNGTGPFKKVSIDLVDRAVFEANPSYWKQGEPKVATLEMVFVKATPDLIPALREGKIDWMASFPLESYFDLELDRNLVVGSIAANQFSNVRIRADRKPGSDPLVRKALRLAIDRDAVNNSIFQGLALRGNDTPVGPLYSALYNETLQAPAHNIAEAKKLLEQAGYPDGLKLDFAVPKGEQNSDELARALQAQWKQAGIDVDIKLVDQSVYYGDDQSPLNWLNADLAVTLWASRPDPQLYLDQLYKTGANYNEAHYSNPELDTLIDQARAETDSTARAELFAQIQKILIEDGPSYILYYHPLFYAHSRKVGGIDLSPDPGLTSFAQAVVEE